MDYLLNIRHLIQVGVSAVMRLKLWQTPAGILDPKKIKMLLKTLTVKRTILILF